MDFLEHLEETKLLEEKIEERRKLRDRLSIDRKSIHKNEKNRPCFNCSFDWVCGCLQ